MLEFQGSGALTIGVEMELQIIDPCSMDLTPQAEKILEKCSQNKLERVKAEIHQSMLEVDSEISRDVKECSAFLKKRILRLSEIVEDLGLQLAITGTHPFQYWPERLITDRERYQNLHEKYQWLVRRVNVYGLHVHVGVKSGDRALSICQKLIPYLPMLMALSANSPFWQGVDTGMQSSRISILESFPFSGLPQKFTRWKEFVHYHDTLYRVGAISSFKDFYWHVRPNLTFGTLEVRFCDGLSSLDDTMAVVALIHCLIAKIDRQLDAESLNPYYMEQYWIAPENQWIAARDGLEGVLIVDLQGKTQKISDAILELLPTLYPLAEELNCKQELEQIKKIIVRGNGAQRQRAIYNETGSLKSVVTAMRQEFLDSLS